MCREEEFLFKILHSASLIKNMLGTTKRATQWNWQTWLKTQNYRYTKSINQNENFPKKKGMFSTLKV
jgi:hypothetical protein